ncbi:uncharacterized protein LOC142817275 [Rhipicephalus microplus]|uniref:uncharacterized protein LOC142817275 n=1 Tax=Rhipicephalus microplus TaxID=6941 RepID=UPI003F6D0A2D
MDSTSLIFSGGRPGKASSVASFFALTLALGTLVVAAFVLFTAFSGWNNLALSMKLRALDPLVEKVPSSNTTRRSRKKPSASPSNLRPRSSSFLYVGKTTPAIKGGVSSVNGAVHTEKVLPGQRTANGTPIFLTRLISVSQSTAISYLSTPRAYGLLRKNMASTSLRVPKRKEPTLPMFTEVFETEEIVWTHDVTKVVNDSPPSLSGGHVTVDRYATYGSVNTPEGIRAAPELSDGSEWLVEELTAHSEDSGINGSAFFLDLNDSSPGHHNYSKRVQRPIFLPEGPPREHKLFASSTSNSELPGASSSPLVLTTALTKTPSSSGTPARQTSLLKKSTTRPATNGRQQPTLQKSHNRMVVQIRESRPTMSFHRPHRHDAVNVTDLPTATEFIYATKNRADRHRDTAIDDMWTRALTGRQDHEGHVPRLSERSPPADDASVPGSPVTLTMLGYSGKVHPTSSTFSLVSATSPRVPDCVTPLVQPLPATIGETEPFVEDVATVTSAGLVTSSRKHDPVVLRTSQGSTGTDIQYGTTHKSHVRKLKVATSKAKIQREATIRSIGDNRRIWKWPTSSNLNSTLPHRLWLRHLVAVV